MRRVLQIAAVSAAATLALAACGEAPAEDESAEGGGSESSADSSDGAGAAPEGAGDFQACMVSDAGGFDDQSFNQSGAQGMESAESELGIQTTLVESQSDADYDSNVSTLVSQGCNLIFGVGFLLEDAVQSAAEDNPETNFALIDSAFSDAEFNPVELDNAKPILFNTAEASFLAGYLAAGTTESGTVATFGGVQIPSVAVFMDGFADGVTRYNEDEGTDVQLLGWDKEAQNGAFSGDFDNQAQGQTLTEQFIAQGADIVMPVAGPVGLGAAAAAESEEGTKIIWVDSDGFETTQYGPLMLTSVLKRIGPAVDDTITETLESGFSNEPYIGTLENDGVGLAPYHDFEGEVPEELSTKIEEYKQQIIDGELTVESPNSPS
ncbi:MAG: BMP family lipoprotein [Ornithinimicrobium sp.]|uniref:BMP family lipoprotein n=1 Tax=Ornithinimicrobium sp. TaxID=1977084 RepID=UPI003D9B3918